MTTRTENSLSVSVQKTQLISTPTERFCYLLNKIVNFELCVKSFQKWNFRIKKMKFPIYLRVIGNFRTNSLSKQMLNSRFSVHFNFSDTVRRATTVICYTISLTRSSCYVYQNIIQTATLIFVVDPDNK